MELEVGQAFVISSLQIWFHHNRVSQEASLCRSKASFNAEASNTEIVGSASWFYVTRPVHGDCRTRAAAQVKLACFCRGWCVLAIPVRYLDKLFEKSFVWDLLIYIWGAGDSDHGIERQLNSVVHFSSQNTLVSVTPATPSYHHKAHYTDKKTNATKCVLSDTSKSVRRQLCWEVKRVIVGEPSESDASSEKAEQACFLLGVAKIQ